MDIAVKGLEDDKIKTGNGNRVSKGHTADTATENVPP